MEGFKIVENDDIYAITPIDREQQRIDVPEIKAENKTVVFIYNKPKSKLEFENIQADNFLCAVRSSDGEIYYLAYSGDIENTTEELFEEAEAMLELNGWSKDHPTEEGVFWMLDNDGKSKYEFVMRDGVLHYGLIDRPALPIENIDTMLESCRWKQYKSNHYAALEQE